jgi:lambda repressor-like predicted transcriptional regulator
MALKKKGMGLRAISRQLGMAVSSVHSIWPGGSRSGSQR